MRFFFIGFMAFTTASTQPVLNQPIKRKMTLGESQRLAKQRSYERRAKRHRVKLGDLAVFTQQLASMLNAGLPLISALEAQLEQMADPVFRIIVRDVRNEVAAGNSFSNSLRMFPRAFPQLFISMVEAGEASGSLASILQKVAGYFEDSLKLVKKVKSALTYPIAVIGLAVVLVNVLLIFVIPVFSEMFADFGQKLPLPTLVLIAVSDFMKKYILLVILVAFGIFKLIGKFCETPRGRRFKDALLLKLPVTGELRRKISLARFCRTYAILLRSGVPILQTLEICSSASGNTYLEKACSDISKHISQGGQVSDILEENDYFPPMVKHMARAGEQTGNIDGMMNKVADFYDTEIDAMVAALTSLLEPALIVILGVIIGGIVMCMFLPIFQLGQVIGG